jgi:hypothetical protein
VPAGDQLFWYNGNGSPPGWQPVLDSNNLPVFASGGGTASVTLTNSTTPTLSELGGTVAAFLVPPTLSGVVFEDFNGDGQVVFVEQGIGGVQITLTGSDGNVYTQPTNAAGAYVFQSLNPGVTYTIRAAPVQGYTERSSDPVGTAGGQFAGGQFVEITLPPDGATVTNGFNYNFAELPTGTGAAVQRGQTAGIGFWNNKNGQALLLALPVVTNPDGSVTSVANWLAATLPNVFSRPGRAEAHRRLAERQRQPAVAATEIAAAAREIAATGKGLSGAMNEINGRARQAAGLAGAGRGRLGSMGRATRQPVESAGWPSPLPESLHRPFSFRAAKTAATAASRPRWSVSSTLASWRVRTPWGPSMVR